MPHHNLRELIEHINDAVLVVDEEGLVLYANPAAEKFFHKTRRELTGSVFGRPAATEGLVEIESISTAGVSRVGEMQVSPVSWNGREAYAMVVRDVTERKRAEEAARRARRAHGVLSAYNRALVAATNEAQFMEDMCRLIVDHGGYEMAWIGLRRHDPGRSIRPVAWAGLESGYLAGLKLTWGDGERGQGPTGRAIRTGRAVVCREIASDPNFSPWRREALERGYASSVALPIWVNGDCIGALNMYAGEPDAFDGEELALIGEMARDLGHGIETIRGREARRKAEESLQQSAERWRATFDAITDIILVISKDHAIIEINSSGCAALGMTREEVIGRKCHALFHSTAMPIAGCPCALATGAHTPSTHEYDQGGRNYRLEAWPLVARNGEREGYVHIIEDVTEQKRAERNLVRFSERLERLAKVVQDLTMARDVGAVARLAVQAACPLAGAAGAAFVLKEGDTYHCLEEDGTEPRWKWRKLPLPEPGEGRTVLERGPVVLEDMDTADAVPWSSCIEGACKSLVLVPVGAPEPFGAVGCYWTEPHRVNEEDLRLLGALADAAGVALENVRGLRAIEESKARTRAIYEHLPNATFVWQRRGEDFVLLDLNHSAIAMTRGGAARFVGRPARELPHALPRMAEDLERCLEKRQVVRRDVTFTSPGGSNPVHLELTYGFIPSDMVILHAEDVTEQRRTQEQLWLAQRLESVGRLAGGVAHDFNNLLSVIINYSEFAIEELPEDDSIRDDLVEVLKAGHRAATLTRQLLAFSRKQVLKPRILDLNDVVRGVEELLRRLLGEDIDIVTSLADDLGRVEADPGQIEQVIVNLAVNARDAMPHGGTLLVETRDEVLDQAYSQQHEPMEPGPFVMLSVSDTGCGMDPEVRRRVFEPFFTTKERGKGTGLGLATVYGIIKQSGGYVWVYSEPGNGTTFKIYLPHSQKVDEPSEAIQDAALQPGGTETILVVEDEDAVRRLAARVLASAGYDVHTAKCGDEALELAQTTLNKIDLLLTDVVMPGMNGRELAERLARLRPSLAVLFMSGYTDEAISHHGVIAPGISMVSKPFSAAGLLSRVRQSLDAPGGGAETFPNDKAGQGTDALSGPPPGQQIR